MSRGAAVIAKTLLSAKCMVVQKHKHFADVDFVLGTAYLKEPKTNQT